MDNYHCWAVQIEQFPSPNFAILFIAYLIWLLFFFFKWILMKNATNVTPKIFWSIYRFFYKKVQRVEKKCNFAGDENFLFSSNSDVVYFIRFVSMRVFGYMSKDFIRDESRQKIQFCVLWKFFTPFCWVFVHNYSLYKNATNLIKFIREIMGSKYLLNQTNYFVQIFLVSSKLLCPAHFCVHHITVSSSVYTYPNDNFCNFSMSVCCGPIMLHLGSNSVEECFKN